MRLLALFRKVDVAINFLTYPVEIKRILIISQHPNNLISIPDANSRFHLHFSFLSFFPAHVLRLSPSLTENIGSCTGPHTVTSSVGLLILSKLVGRHQFHMNGENNSNGYAWGIWVTLYKIIKKIWNNL